MTYSAPNRCSIQHRDARALNEILSPRQKSSVRLQVKGLHLKSGKQVKQSDSGQHSDISRKFATRNSLPPSSMGNHQKPLPGRKARGLDEVVRNMSSVPCYLQRLEKGDNVQEKALNFGVLEWGRLEKWTYLQKQVATRRDGHSPSSSNASSSPFSTVGASSQSTRSSDSPLPRRKQSPTLVAQSNYSPDARRSKQVKEQNRGHLLRCPDSRASYATMSTANNRESRKSNGSDMKGIYCEKSRASNTGCSPSASRGHNTSSFAHDMAKTEINKSREAKNFHSCEQSSPDLRLAENSIEEQCSVIEGMWNDLQETVHKRRISCDSAVVSKERPIEVNRNSFSGNFPTDDIQFANISPHLSRSCPLSSSSHNDEPSSSCNPLSNEAANADAEGKRGMHDLFTDSSSRAVKMASRPGPDEVKVPTSLRRDLSPHRLLRAGINRIKSSSLRESTSGHEIKRTSCSYEDDEAACTRGRRSPLRRMLDPLLKSNNRNQFSGPIASSHSHRAQEVNNSNKLPIRDELKLANGSCKPSDASNNPSASQATQSCSPVQDQKDVTSTRQALLKLSWKNGFPLFMFSSHDNNILAATMGKRSITEKNDFECIYTLFTAHEMKKKGGIWMSQGNKIKKHGLVYNVVGQMKVSSKSTKEESKSYSVAREFVLYGAQLIPTGHDQPVSLLNSELAAIVVKIPGEDPESSKFDSLQSNNCRNSSQTKLPEDKCSSIVAILPSGVHGLSSAGEPSPLVKRWKSGGSCDCGGWDEGCLLTVLTNKAEGRSTCGSAQSSTSAGTHRIELFNQGEARVKEHAFTMVAFKEGVYTVEFGPSIALLQAFAICIATLHSWKPTSLAGLHYSVEARSTKDNTFVDYTRMVPRKATGRATIDYAPDHPPLSPIGRT